MASDWIIDVLADLRDYATTHGMSATAACIEDATLIALAEAASPMAPERNGRAAMARAGHDDGAGTVTWLFAERGHA